MFVHLNLKNSVLHALLERFSMSYISKPFSSYQQGTLAIKTARTRKASLEIKHLRRGDRDYFAIIPLRRHSFESNYANAIAMLSGWFKKAR